MDNIDHQGSVHSLPDEKGAEDEDDKSYRPARGISRRVDGCGRSSVGPIVIQKEEAWMRRMKGVSAWWISTVECCVLVHQGLRKCIHI